MACVGVTGLARKTVLPLKAWAVAVLQPHQDVCFYSEIRVRGRDRKLHPTIPAMHELEPLLGLMML